MIRPLSSAGSIRQRLVLLLLAGAAVVSALLYLSVRTVANTAVETTQDSILGAATIAIAEELRGGVDGIAVEIPYTTFSMLGSTGEDRVFYRIIMNGETVTGYEDLPVPEGPVTGLTPQFMSADFQDARVRIGAVERRVLVGGKQVAVTVLVAQTRSLQAQIGRQMARRAAVLGLGLYVLAAVLSVLTARAVLQPLNTLAEAMGRRGPQDLRPVEREVPTELAPLMGALNGFIARLRGALSRTETFITEAAHHVRTPLATVRAQAEIALRQTDDDTTRATLRNVIRAVDDSARSAGQLLDHATVVYRSDQRADDELDLCGLVSDVAHAFAPSAELRDISLTIATPDAPMTLGFDRLLLESALRNLIDNALKYSHAEGMVDVALTQRDASAIITVKDRGRGIGDSDTARLAKRFQRGDNADDVIGSGLGLTIVRDVARAIGGHFTLTPRTGGGTCATLILPLD